MDYKVGASCDYSFIPEMCPSGNVAVINDSDDYLVVETQPMSHEMSSIKWGAYENNLLLSILGEWTTKQHRENAQHTIYFHSRDLTDQDKMTIEKSFDRFMSPIATALNQYPVQPHHNHPYWIGAVKTFNRHRYLMKDVSDYDYMDSSVNELLLWEKYYHRIYGAPPCVFRWHHRWREFHFVRKAIKQYVTPKNYKNTAIFYDTYQSLFMRYCSWFKKVLGVTQHYYIRNLKYAPRKIQELRAQQLDVGVLMIRLDDIQCGNV